MVPNLRFSSFADSFRIYTLKEVLQRVSFPVTVEENKLYYQIGIRSHSKGIFYKEAEIGKQIGNKRIFWIEPNCLILNIVFAWEQAVAKTSEKEVGMVASHRFPMYKVLNNSLDYIVDFFKTEKGKQLLQMASPGGAGRNKTLNQDFFLNSKIYLPSLNEQLKTSELIELIEGRIETQIKIIRVLESQKKELSKILFNKYCKDSSYYPLEDIVSSESIKDFQIQTKDYLPNGKFEVVDQGKKEIIGYSDNSNKLYTKVPVIVYGDHTTIIKYREIPFIVGGDGVKLLKAKTGFLQKYIYYAVCQFNISSEGYKRHWNMLKNVLIPIPNYETQKIIIDTLDSFTKKIKNEEALLEKYRLQKQFLLNNLFI